MYIKALIKLIDVKTLVAGAVPVLLGSVYSLYAYGKMNGMYLAMLLIAMALVQSSANMINDYFDYMRGADGKERAGEKVLVSGEMSPKQVLLLIGLFHLIAVAIGIYLSGKTSPFVLLVYAIGALISVLYASGPMPLSHLPVGEVVSGLTMGVGITSTVIFIQSGVFNVDTVLVAIPTALYIATVMLSNNLSDAKEDGMAGRRTLPVLLGTRKTEIVWMIIVLSIWALTAFYVWRQLYPLQVLLLAILFFPVASLRGFFTYEKNIHTKGRTMSLIGKVGILYHVSVLLGLGSAIFFNR